MAFESNDNAHQSSNDVGEEACVFQFEADFANDLRCIPMIVRLKLDRCGIKVSLRQWSRFMPEDRADLAKQRCDTTPEIADFRNGLVRLIEQRGGGAVVELEIEADPPWADLCTVPARIIQHASSIGINPPSPGAWSALLPLQRFALLKLTRDNHDNFNFLPAMREFELLGRS